MDFLNKVTGGGGGMKPEEKEHKTGGGGFMDKVNALAGGGQDSEKNEDGLDKGLARSIPRKPMAPYFCQCFRPRIRSVDVFVLRQG